MRKDRNYRKAEEQNVSSGIRAKKKTVQLAAILLGISFVLAGCGGAEDKSGDSGAVNTTESVNGESTGSTESAGSTESTGSEESTGDAKAEAAEVSPQDIYKMIGESTQLPSMVEGDDDFISNYYGIDPADLDSYVFASAEDATLATSVIIMKAKSEDGVDALVNSLNTVIEQKAAEMQGYIPEQYDVVADSSVKTQGLYVYLIIAENAGDIESVISSALK